MKRFLAALGVGLFLVGCAPRVAEVPPRDFPAPEITEVSTTIPVTPDGGFLIGRGVTHENLTVFPILSKVERKNDRLLTLDEGLANGTVDVKELAAGNRRGENPSPDPFGAPVPLTPSAADPFGDPAQPAPAPASAPSPAVNVADPFDPFKCEGESEEETPAEPILVPPVPDNDPFGGAIQSFGNSVNRVVVINKSDKPLYLMPGEIILGGDQDRTIGRELVIAPTGEPVEIDVYCVEHGRWGGKGVDVTFAQLSALRMSTNQYQTYAAEDYQEEATADAKELSVDELRKVAAEADQGRFVASAGALSKSGRVAAQHEKDQTKVWDEVAAANAKGGVASGSGAFTGQYVEADAMKRLDPYLEHLLQPISDQPNVVGVVVAIDGRTESFDVFESTPLFRKLWPKLLKSFAVDAANAADSRGPDEKTPLGCTQQVAATFVREAIAAEATTKEESGGLSIATTDTDKVLLFSAHDPTQRPFVTSVVPVVDGQAAPAAVFGGGGAFGGSVHGFGAAK